MKSGIFTTEFWGKAVLQLAAIMNLFMPEGMQVVEDPAIVVAFVGVLESFYIGFRTLLKKADLETAVYSTVDLDEVEA